MINEITFELNEAIDILLDLKERELSILMS